MATYKGIQGYSVQTLASDPSPTASVEGQLWFNSTSSTYKIATAGAGAWSSSNPLLTPRNGSAGAGISQTAAICFGGTSGPTLQDQTESYDGTSWTEVNDLNTTRYSLGGLGTVTAAMAISGYADADPLPAAIETYDGTSWTTNPVSMPYAAVNVGQGGTTTAAVVWGGQAPPIWVMRDNTIIWNGSTWTEVADTLAPAWANGSGFGSQTAALAAGSRQPALTGDTELWDGTSWSEVNNMNTARSVTQGCGTTTAGMVNGGQVSPSPPANAFSALTEKWDGTSWTEVGDLTQGRYDQGEGPNCPSGDSVIWGGSGNGIPYSNVCEEWTDPILAVKTVTTS